MCPRLIGSAGGAMKTAILLVDDDLLLLALNAELLSELGYTVTTARNGSEALTILGNGHAVHALVTDLQMPGLHGFELARRARSLRPSLTILYLTGHPELSAGEMGQALGPVLSKPCTAERLHHEIKRMHASTS